MVKKIGKRWCCHPREQTRNQIRKPIANELCRRENEQARTSNCSCTMHTGPDYQTGTTVHVLYSPKVLNIYLYIVLLVKNKCSTFGKSGYYDRRWPPTVAKWRSHRHIQFGNNPTPGVRAWYATMYSVLQAELSAYRSGYIPSEILQKSSCSKFFIVTIA